MKISVIIPTFNRVSLLGRAIDSVLKQSLRDFELLVVDDGSTDGTQDFIQEKYIQESRLKYFKISHRGVSGARNFGIRKSLGNWIALLDSDDEWLPHRLEKQQQLWKRQRSLRLIHGEEIWIRRGVRVNPKRVHQKFGGFIFEKCLPLCLISPSATLMEKALLEEVGLFDEEFVVCEDYDLWLKITSLYPVGFVEEPIIIKYGGHGDQLSARFKAMDFWRVQSLVRLLEIRDFSSEKRERIIEEILKKASLLEKGYLKYNREKELISIRKTLERFSPPGN